MEATTATVLLVEDHVATRAFLADNLCIDGFGVLEAECVLDALGVIETEFPDLAIVDLGLPDTDGLELLSDVRDSDRVAGTIDPELPLLVLTGRGAELDRLRGFERGCDDYIVKPLSYRELRARIVALLRRTSGRPGSGRVRVGALELDPSSRRVRLHNRSISRQRSSLCSGRWRLSPPEFSRAMSC